MKRQYKRVILIFVRLLTIIGLILFYNKEKTFYKKSIERKSLRMEKFWSYFCVLDRWLKLKENNQKLDICLKDLGYERVAVYGLGKLGEHLITELEYSQVKVICGIDQNINNGLGDIVTFRVGDKLPDIDVVIVTPVHEFYEIRDKLKTYVKCDIISLDEIVLRSELMKGLK